MTGLGGTRIVFCGIDIDIFGGGGRGIKGPAIATKG
jgi:hypothetical protein